MRFIDVYKNCKGCPVKQYCGTMVSSIRLCNSYTLVNYNIEMKIKFDTWEKENITVSIEDIDSIDSHDALTTILYLKNGTSYRPFGKIKFI
jgi:hypothetical protein